MLEKQLNGKWALVTGSSRGIGQYIALGLANEGCNIIIHGRNETNCTETQELIRDYNVESFIVSGDLLYPEDVSGIIKAVFQKREGGIDILYNNAAVMSKPGNICEIPEEEWQRVFRINFFSVITLCNAFIPGMKKRNYGRIINLSSGIQDQPDLAPYSTSKAAINKYTQDLAYALKENNILVNYLDPGWIKTDLGGKNAWFELETVLPGVLIPALLENDGPSGRGYAAQDYKIFEY